MSTSLKPTKKEVIVRGWANAIFRDGMPAGTVARESGVRLRVFRRNLGQFLKANPGFVSRPGATGV